MASTWSYSSSRGSRPSRTLRTKASALPAAVTSTSSKHFVHIRDFAFFKQRLRVTTSDEIIFVQDNKSAGNNGHMVVVVGADGASSGLLRHGERWVLSCGSLTAGRTYRVTDPAFTFMTSFISVAGNPRDSESSPKANGEGDGGVVAANGKKAGSGGSGSSDQSGRYADSFVYAAANNQITIVQRRLGLTQAAAAAAAGGGGAAPPSASHNGALPVIFDPNVTDSDGCHALGAAAKGGHVEVMKVLLRAGADVNARTRDGDADTALHLACKWGKAAAARALLEWSGGDGGHDGGGGGGVGNNDANDANEGRGERRRFAADAHALNDLGRTPLHLAALNGHGEAVAALLSLRTVDPHLADYSGKTPLDIAADYGRSRLEIGEALVAYANQVWAPEVCAVLATCGLPREQFAWIRTGERDSSSTGGGSSSASSGASSPFGLEYLTRVGWDALGLISRFVAAPPRDAMAAVAAIRERTGGAPRRLTDGADRFDLFLSQSIENDPRARSLPYLLRQDRERRQRQLERQQQQQQQQQQQGDESK